MPENRSSVQEENSINKIEPASNAPSTEADTLSTVPVSYDETDRAQKRYPTDSFIYITIARL